MEKQAYMKHAMRVIHIQQQHHLLGDSDKKVNSNVGIKGAGTNGEITGGTGDARGRGFDDWDD